MKTKLCSLCGQDLPATLEYFYWNARDQCFQSGCRVCRSEKAKGKAFDNRAIVLAARAERRRDARIKLEATGVKQCGVCRREKPLADFAKNPTCVLGRSGICRECSAARQRVYVSRPEHVARTWARKLWYSTGETAKRKGYEFTLTEQDILDLFAQQNGRCYWFNVPLLPTHAHKHPQKPSVDRLDAARGYTRDNVVLACYSANIGRNTSTAEAFRAFVVLLRESLATLPSCNASVSVP